MISKEKANELIEKFYKIKLDFIYVHDNDSYVGNENMTYKSAVKCAIIAVDEILSLGYVGNEPSSFRVYKFYSDVKLEIELELKN